MKRLLKFNFNTILTIYTKKFKKYKIKNIIQKYRKNKLKNKKFITHFC